MRAAIYVRISQDRTGAGLGVERQADDCQQLCEAKSWKVVEVYVDNDVSAFSGNADPNGSGCLLTSRPVRSTRSSAGTSIG